MRKAWLGREGLGFSFERVTFEMLVIQLSAELSCQWLDSGLLPRLEVQVGESPVMKRKDSNVGRKNYRGEEEG